jgi:hypothetical protein
MPVAFLALVHAVRERIPDGATVAAEDRLAPQLTSSRTVYLFPRQPDGWTRPEWVVLRADAGTGPAPGENGAAQARLPALGYRAVARGGGVVLYRRTP